MSACRSCQTPIVWAVNSVTGAKTPVDTNLDNVTKYIDLWKAGSSDSNIPNPQLLGVSGNRGVETCRPLTLELDGDGWTTDQGETERLGINHFQTCPNAKEHRKPKE